MIAQASAEFTPENIAPKYADMRALAGTALSEWERARGELTERLARANSAIANLLRAIESGSPPAALITQLAARETERDTLSEQLAATPAIVHTLPIIDIEEYCIEMRRRLASTDPAEQRLVLRAVVERVDCTRELVKVKVRPFPV